MEYQITSALSIPNAGKIVLKDKAAKRWLPVQRYLI